MPTQLISGDVTMFHDRRAYARTDANPNIDDPFTPADDRRLLWTPPTIPGDDATTAQTYWNVQAITAINRDTTLRSVEFIVLNPDGAEIARLPVGGGAGRTAVRAGEAASFAGRFIVPFPFYVGLRWDAAYSLTAPLEGSVMCLQSKVGGVVL